uniref:Uncharacterized protein n=1 Tax=Attheya septentrionalis TaxID=420275 RepID=A0A7S2XRK4_9STRA|mmetsp:Transcript_29436/g.53919  ORF Transcript_29436/g.53919 Transcript_29436/m.53919 type:complete len:303 (+) Transcript_29436:115-1023(+)|eukprot:CAMPEP_0198293292 /NCGR_PEP_ID=MMETSP1449-20131203/16365_1 /TAXON_ID=420275 /ORGANISM="Attheya septentrionalis, Strain CCMP2084" /LENGTH=302 /DNA_ID=CAMNT_0043992819 /DNA_START=83 /DNA_END=991 /DNA_ORIENTATION=+
MANAKKHAAKTRGEEACTGNLRDKSEWHESFDSDESPRSVGDIFNSADGDSACRYDQQYEGSDTQEMNSFKASSRPLHRTTSSDDNTIRSARTLRSGRTLQSVPEESMTQNAYFDQYADQSRTYDYTDEDTRDTRASKSGKLSVDSRYYYESEDNDNSSLAGYLDWNEDSDDELSFNREVLSKPLFERHDDLEPTPLHSKGLSYLLGSDRSEASMYWNDFIPENDEVSEELVMKLRRLERDLDLKDSRGENVEAKVDNLVEQVTATLERLKMHIDPALLENDDQSMQSHHSLFANNFWNEFH